MKKLYLVFLITFSAILTSCSTVEDTISFEAMNTFMTIRSFGIKSAKANQEVKKRIEQLENTISTTKGCSDVWKVNHSAGVPVLINKDTEILTDFSLKLANATEGAFNPCLYPVIREWGFTTGEYKVPDSDVIESLLGNTNFTKVKLFYEENIPSAISTTAKIQLEKGMMLDFGAVGKGYAGDESVKVLKSAGIKSAILDLGGNVQALGTKIDGSAWTIGIRSPFTEGTDPLKNHKGTDPVVSLKIQDKAVITSGGYERFFIDETSNHRYIHIFDGKTGRPVENNIASVTIVADSGLYGDALSTTLVVFGLDKAISFWKEHRDFDFLIITKDQKLYYSSSLKNSLKTLYNFAEITVIN